MAWRIIDIQLPDRDQVVTPDTFGFRLGRIGRDGGKKTSGKSRRRHKRDATEHIQTSVWRERLPRPRPEKLTA